MPPPGFRPAPWRVVNAPGPREFPGLTNVFRALFIRKCGIKPGKSMKNRMTDSVDHQWIEPFGRTRRRLSRGSGKRRARP